MIFKPNAVRNNCTAYTIVDFSDLIMASKGDVRNAANNLKQFLQKNFGQPVIVVAISKVLDSATRKEQVSLLQTLNRKEVPIVGLKPIDKRPRLAPDLDGQLPNSGNHATSFVEKNLAGKNPGSRFTLYGRSCTANLYCNNRRRPVPDEYLWSDLQNINNETLGIFKRYGTPEYFLKMLMFLVIRRTEVFQKTTIGLGFFVREILKNRDLAGRFQNSCDRFYTDVTSSPGVAGESFCMFMDAYYARLNKYVELCSEIYTSMYYAMSDTSTWNFPEFSYEDTDSQKYFENMFADVHANYF